MYSRMSIIARSALALQQKEGVYTAIVGGASYSGSAASTPPSARMFFGGVSLSRSRSRIHSNNLLNRILLLVFINESDYDDAPGAAFQRANPRGTCR